MIKIITVGQIKEKYLQDAIKEYKKRLSKYTNIEVIEVKAIKLEAEKIKKHINDRDYIVTLEIEGKQMTSVEFANKIDNILIENSNVDFIIGGSYGLSDDIKNMSRLHLSFSKMTFPHQLFRVMLLEQIYRASTISNNILYHK